MLAKVQVPVTALPHPFDLRRVDFTVDEGASIDDILLEVVARADIDPSLLRFAAVCVGDHIVPKEMWHHVRPKAPVVVRALPGDDFLPYLVMIAGFALNAFVPGIGTLAIGSINIGQFAVRAAITIATSLIAQAVTPAPKQARLTKDAPAEARYAVTGSRNQAQPYGIEPVIYGRLVNYNPLYAAQPYTETWGGELQFIRMLFTPGLGIVSMSDLRVGDTPFASFKNFSYETRTGAPGEPPVTLFPRQVREEALQIQLLQRQGYTYRTTELDTDEISVEVACPSGMGRISDRNVKFGIEIKFRIHYFGPGMSGYAPAPLQQDTGGGVTLYGDGVFSIAGYSKSAVRRSVRFRLPRGQYSVGIARVTTDDQSDNVGDNQSTTFEDTYLTTVRSIRNEAPLARTGIALISIFAQASEQLSGVIDTLNCTVQRHLPVWNGSTWATVPTRNPAWAFVDVLCGAGNARPLTYDRLDLPAILSWAQWCDAEGITFDGVFAEQRGVWDWLQDICAAGFASPTVRDGLISLVHDTYRTIPAQHFTPRNSRGYRATKLFGDLPHGLIVRFPNERTLHQTDEIKVYADGYTEATASKFEVLELPYTTSAALAHKAARRFIASATLRPEITTIETDVEWITCERGDLVLLTHDVPKNGIGWGRVKSVVVDGGGDCLAVTLDTAWTLAADTAYSIRFRLSTGSSVHALTVAGAGEYWTFTLATPIPFGDPQPEAGTLTGLGITGRDTREMIVRSIEARGDLSALITLVDYSPEIFTADRGPIPDYDPGINLPAPAVRKAPPMVTVTSVSSDEAALLEGGGGVLLSRILIGYELRQQSDQLPATAVQARWRRTNSAEEPEYRIVPPAAGVLSIMPVEDGVTYLVELRSVAAAGAASAWLPIEHTVIGKTSPPPDVERIYRARDSITWPYPNPPRDFAGFRVRAHTGTSANWETARPLHQGLLSVAELSIAEFAGTQTIMVKAVDTSGNESTNAAVLVLNLGDVLVENVLLTQSEAPTFAGLKVDGTVASGVLKADSSTLFWPPDGALFWPAAGSDPFWPVSNFKAMEYVARYTPITDHIGAVVKVDATAVGEYALDYRAASSPAFWPVSGAAAFWPVSGSDLFWADEVQGPWMPFPGVLGPIIGTADSYDIRATFAGGLVQGELSVLDILVDVPDVLEVLQNVSILSGGTQLPFTKPFRAVKYVRFTTHGAYSASLRAGDYDLTTGLICDLKSLATGAATAGSVSADLLGY